MKRSFLLIPIVIFAMVSNSSVSQAKGGDEQNQIILLNDSAAALEDSNPGLSRSLGKFADEEEKDWEGKSTNKDELPTPVTDQYKAQTEERVKLLKAAALAIQPAYPLIAKSLSKMAKDLNRSIEIEK